MPTFKYSPGDKPLDGYWIEYAVGKGGFGEVYFAKSDAGREVALKAIVEHEETELRGVRNCMNVVSPRLVTIHDVQRASDGVVWIVMEYVRGPSLQDIFSESPNGLEPVQAVYLLRELALGLSDLHNAGIVHRDLKPSNVFFDGGRVKIGDYSLSKSIANHEQSQHTMTVGSVHYMAPEISRGRYDATVDIYALGVIFYEMLTGHHPHAGETVGEVLMKHLHADVDVESIGPEFQDVIQTAMSRDPSSRYQTAEEFAKSAVKSIDFSYVDDSFCPATLSLIGERARQERQHAIAGQSVPSPATTASTSAVAPTRSLEIRLCHAATLTLIATTFQVVLNNRGGLGPFDGSLFALGVFGTAMIPAYRLLRWTTRDTENSKPWRDILWRIGTSISAAFSLFAFSTLLTPLEVEGIVVTCLSVALALSAIDWRRHVQHDRPATIQRYPTIASGGFAAMFCILIQMPEWWAFSTATTMGVTLSLQAVAPRCVSAEKDSPPGRRGLVPLQTLVAQET